MITGWHGRPDKKVAILVSSTARFVGAPSCISSPSATFFFFFGLDVLLTLEGVSRNVGLSPNHTQDRTLRSHHFVWTSHVTPWSSSRHFMEPNDSLSSAQGLGLRHCPEQSESSPQPPRLFILPSALWSSNWFVPLRLATENSVLIYCFPCVHSQPAHPIFLDTIIRIVFPTN